MRRLGGPKVTKGQSSIISACLLVLVFAPSSLSLGQDILTNRSVVDMVKTGLSAEIIIAKIQSSIVAFDTSAAALKELSDAGVPERVVVAMITEAGKMAKASAKSEKESNELLKSVPEQGKLRDILSKTKFFIATDDLKARDRIEKELMKVKKYTIVDRIEDCELLITYESWIETVNVTATVVGNTATARENTQLVGVLTVKSTSDSEPGRIRQIYSSRKVKYFIWEDNPAESTTKQFIKDLTRAAALNPSP